MGSKTYDNVRTLVTDKDLERQWYMTLTKAQQDRVARITVGYTVNGSKVAVRVIPKCKGWKGAVAAVKEALADDGRKGIWTREWKPCR